jgi:hypothetical protein
LPVPSITIFVRHIPECLNAKDEFYKRCSCWKHLRWTYYGKQYRKATKSWTWAGAERQRRELELSYEAAGQPPQPDSPPTIQ